MSREREHLQVYITAPYLELRSGPGRGFPVFHVAERDESVEVLFRRTDWFKVRTERGVEGWAAQRDMLRTVLADGTPFKFDLGDRAGFTSHNFEMGIFAGCLQRLDAGIHLRVVLIQLATRRGAVGRTVPRQVHQRRCRRPGTHSRTGT